MTASGSRRAMVAAAQPMQGAVLRGTGSTRKFFARQLGQRRRRRLDEVRAGGTRIRSQLPTSGRTRRAVSRIIDPRTQSGRSCFGRVERDAGQKRVPAPPARMRTWASGVVIAGAGAYAIGAQGPPPLNRRPRAPARAADALR